MLSLTTSVLFHFVVLPDSFVYSNEDVQSVKGSSAVGLCGVPSAIDYSRSRCYDSSSVLLDGYVPTVLTGDRWASLLFTIHPRASESEAVTFDFQHTESYRELRGVEVVMVNGCY